MDLATAGTYKEAFYFWFAFFPLQHALFYIDAQEVRGSKKKDKSEKPEILLLWLHKSLLFLHPVAKIKYERYSTSIMVGIYYRSPSQEKKMDEALFKEVTNQSKSYGMGLQFSGHPLEEQFSQT